MTRSCWRCSLSPAYGPCPRASDASPADRRRSRVAARRVAGARDYRLDDPSSIGTGVGGGRGRRADGIGQPRGTRGGGRGVRRRDLPGTRGAGRRGRSGPKVAPLGPHRDSGGRSELAASSGDSHRADQLGRGPCRAHRRLGDRRDRLLRSRSRPPARVSRGGPKGVRWVGGLADLPRLAAESDCLVITAPHTAETRGAVSRVVLERLPHDAIVVNVSRGTLLDETALLAVLDASRVRGAALDVFAAEPLPAGHPFWRHPRVLVSPHVAAVTARFWERETGLIVENIRRYLAGSPLANTVDLEAGY